MGKTAKESGERGGCKGEREGGGENVPSAVCMGIVGNLLCKLILKVKISLKVVKSNAVNCFREPVLGCWAQ